MKKLALLIVLSAVLIFSNCVSRDTDYTVKYEAFLNYSLGSGWEVLDASQGGHHDGIISYREWRLAYKDKNGVARTFSFDNSCPYTEEDDVYFTRFVIAEALRLASDDLNAKITPYRRIGFDTYMLKYADHEAIKQMTPSMLSPESGLKLCALDAPTLLTSGPYYVHSTLNTQSPDDFQERVAQIDALYQDIFAYTQTPLAILIEVTLYGSNPQGEPYVVSHEGRLWIGGKQVDPRPGTNAWYAKDILEFFTK